MRASSRDGRLDADYGQLVPLVGAVQLAPELRPGLLGRGELRFARLDFASRFAFGGFQFGEFESATGVIVLEAGDQALVVQRIVDAIYASAEAGREVAVSA